MKKYFIHNGTQQDGPFDVEELRLKNLHKDSPVWFEGLTDWTTISKVEELKNIIPVVPPPFAAKTTSSAPIEKPIAYANVTTSETKKGSSVGQRLLILSTIIVLILIGTYFYKQMQHQEYQEIRQASINTEVDRKKMTRDNITSLITAERSSYNFSSLGGISNLSLSVTNQTDYIIDNVKVRVIYLKPNGQVWNSRFVDFNLLNPKTKSTIKVADTERGVSVKYEIASIKSNALELN